MSRHSPQYRRTWLRVFAAPRSAVALPALALALWISTPTRSFTGLKAAMIRRFTFPNSHRVRSAMFKDQIAS